METEVASNGYEAIEKSNTKAFDLITADIVHPGPTGIHVAKVARESLSNSGTPIFLLSVYFGSGIIENFELEIRLPFDVGTLKRAATILCGKPAPTWTEEPWTLYDEFIGRPKNSSKKSLLDMNKAFLWKIGMI
jgi:hypothetical protein